MAITIKSTFNPAQRHRAFRTRLYNTAVGVAQKMEAQAKANAPVRTGRLRNEIRAEATQDANGVRITLRGDAPYTVYQERGTRYIQPKYFLANAWRDQHGEMRRLAAQVPV